MQFVSRLQASLAGLVLCLAGCASATSDPNRSTYLDTGPVAADCTLSGRDFAQRVSAPVSVQLPVKSAPISIECNADGFFAASEIVDTEMNAWVLGNILIGGVVGVIIDSASGNSQTYPSKIRVVLQPTSFSSVDERDSWLTGRRNEIEAEWSKALQDLEFRCRKSASAPANCKELIEAVENAREAELLLLENNIRETRIDPDKQPAEPMETAASLQATSSDEPDEVVEDPAAAALESKMLETIADGNFDGRWRLRLDISAEDAALSVGYTMFPGLCVANMKSETDLSITEGQFSGDMVDSSGVRYITYRGSIDDSGRLMLKAYHKNNVVTTELEASQYGFDGRFRLRGAWIKCDGDISLVPLGAS